MRYGYGRVSTKGQKRYGLSLEEQRDTLLANGIGEDQIFLDAFTGTKMDRPEFDRLLGLLGQGDELVVCKLDRFARTAPEGALLVRDLVDRGVRVNILNMGVADNTPMGKVMVTVMLAFAEYERDMIVERTGMGKAYKREHDPDWRDGRRQMDVDVTRMPGETVSGACKRLGISRNTYYRRLREATA